MAIEICNFSSIMKSEKPVVGVIGVGHLGQHHVKHTSYLKCEPCRVI
ncbi:MAG: hypothetical protein Ct9H300mP2_1340 [Candidatus Neomarinimicrobiota bacterium]|nr:MAG: hypothetical protein Ct9H300mP2_1340 [Candidatus Neomarinimicrobiota bacterium]